MVSKTAALVVFKQVIKKKNRSPATGPKIGFFIMGVVLENEKRVKRVFEDWVSPALKYVSKIDPVNLEESFASVGFHQVFEPETNRFPIPEGCFDPGKWNSCPTQNNHLE